MLTRWWGTKVPHPVHHGHSHDGEIVLSRSVRARVRTLLCFIVVPLALATFVSLVILWPKGETPVGSRELYSQGVQPVVGSITSIGQTDSSGQTPVRMRVHGVEVPVHVPPETVANVLEVGDEIRAIFNPAALETGTAYIFTDFVRTNSMLALLTLYVVAVLLVARVKGFMALLGLAASLGVVAFFMIPALTVSAHPVAVILTAASAMMFASIYLAHGVTIRTTTAVLGTFAGLMITAVIAVCMVDAAKLTGVLSDDALLLMGEIPGINLQALLLGGMILAGLGALNDVTITQVSTVWELHSANPRMSRRRLFRQAMTVGSDHIASTVYTLTFAYVGTAVTLLVSASLMKRGVTDLVQVSEIAEEIVRTLVASIGLVLAIPLTTAIASLLAPVAPTRVNDYGEVCAVPALNDEENNENDGCEVEGDGCQVDGRR